LYSDLAFRQWHSGQSLNSGVGRHKEERVIFLIKIEFATIEKDYEYLAKNDWHIQPEIVEGKLQQNEILMIKDSQRAVGWLRYGFFWDTIPFMNMLFVEESERGKGLGRKLVEFWECEMERRGYDKVIESQHVIASAFC
jgi:GNAT superfamily N-acetyltransferase